MSVPQFCGCTGRLQKCFAMSPSFSGNVVMGAALWEREICQHKNVREIDAKAALLLSYTLIGHLLTHWTWWRRTVLLNFDFMNKVAGVGGGEEQTRRKDEKVLRRSNTVWHFALFGQFQSCCRMILCSIFVNSKEKFAYTTLTFTMSPWPANRE